MPLSLKPNIVIINLIIKVVCGFVLPSPCMQVVALGTGSSIEHETTSKVVSRRELETYRRDL